MPSRNAQGQLYLLHMDVSLPISPGESTAVKCILICHIQVKVQIERCYLQMSLDGATSFIILWSKDSDNWDVRH